MNLPILQGVSTNTDFAELIQQVGKTGKNIAEKGGNRHASSFSELAMFSTVAALAYWGINFLFFRKNLNSIVSLLIVALIIFFLIPTFKWTAGIAGLLLHTDIVWRFFFGGPWFLFLPLIVFKITCRCRYPQTYASFLLLTVLTGIFFLSQNYFNKALSGNVYSLYNSFFKDRVGVQYTADTLTYLEQKIENKTGGLDKKEVLLYIRSDLATLSRAVYGYYALSHRRISIPMHHFYGNHMEQQYKLVPINLPPDFPKDRNIFLRFKLDAKNISSAHPPILTGGSTTLFKLDHVDLGKEYLFIEGWAFLEAQRGESVVYIVLQSDQNTFMFDTSQRFRRDVGKYFRSTEFENKGFLATIIRKDLKPGNYRIGLLIKQKDQQGMVFSKLSVIIPGI
jgi:hypothetical protein